MTQLTMIDCKKTIPCDSRRTVLDNALRNGITYPHSCRSGQCGTCKSRVLSGQIKYEQYDRHALSDDERDNGYFLACRAKPVTDLTITWDQNNIPNNISGQVVEKTWLTHNVIRLKIKPSIANFAFKPGQYANLQFEGLPSRPYSMASSPIDHELEFHIRVHPNGQVSTYIAENVMPGDSLVLTGPFGNSYYQNNPGKPCIGIAGGTGLAPILSILKSHIANNKNAPFFLYFSVNQKIDLYYLKEIQTLINELAVSKVEVVLAKEQHPGYRSGAIQSAVHDDFINLSDFEIYIAGSPPMVNAVLDIVKSRGAIPNSIFSDSFEHAENIETQSPPAKTTLLKRLFDFS